MSDPTISTSALTWNCDDVSGYSSGGAIDPESVDGKIVIGRQNLALELLGASDTVLDQNDGAISVTGDQTPGGVDAWDDLVVDTAAFKIAYDTGGADKWDNVAWGAVAGPIWNTHSFWFYDYMTGGPGGRRWGLGEHLAKFQLGNGIIGHPGHATWPTEYIWVEGFTGWTGSTVTGLDVFTTGKPRAIGWHYVLHAAIDTLLTSIRIITFDDSVIKFDVGAAGAYRVPNGPRIGAQLNGDFTSHPLYLDTVRSYNGQPYPLSLVVTFPAAQPSSLLSLQTKTITEITAGPHWHGDVSYFYEVSRDSQVTWSAQKELTDANLAAETFVGNGQEAIRPVAFMSSGGPGVAIFPGFFSPAIDSIVITYNSLWAEEHAPTVASAFTEEIN